MTVSINCIVVHMHTPHSRTSSVPLSHRHRELYYLNLCVVTSSISYSSFTIIIHARIRPTTGLLQNLKFLSAVTNSKRKQRSGCERGISPLPRETRKLLKFCFPLYIQKILYTGTTKMKKQFRLDTFFCRVNQFQQRIIEILLILY